MIVAGYALDSRAADAIDTPLKNSIDVRKIENDCEWANFSKKRQHR
jgi:hypothetical protein